MARVSAILVEFCRQKNFFGAGDGQVSTKVDTMREFSQDMKRVSNELVFVDKIEDLLKEAMTVLKKCDPSF
jgi:hypothetical protein